MADALYDVAIIGGGPAGSIAAASLSLAGRKVAVFEREKFPRFHIRESLLPFSMEAFERLGLMPKLEAADLCADGAEITSGCEAAKSASISGTAFARNDRPPCRSNAPSSIRFCSIMPGNAGRTCARKPPSKTLPCIQAGQGSKSVGRRKLSKMSKPNTSSIAAGATPSSAHDSASRGLSRAAKIRPLRSL